MSDIPYQSASEGESCEPDFRQSRGAKPKLGAHSGRMLSGTTLSGQSENISTVEVVSATKKKRMKCGAVEKT